MKKKELFWGLLLVLAAILIIVNQLGFFKEISMFEMVATILLIGIIIKSLRYFNFAGILFPLAFLCIIYAKAWNITDLTPWPILLTALLGSIGLSMIFKKHEFWHHHFHHEHFDEIIDQEDGNIVNCHVSFGSSIKYINTDNFERAKIQCSFGAMKVYFDKAIVSSGNGYIDLDVSFSGVELYIPKTWKVINEVNTSLGAIEEKNRSTESNSPVVTIRGNISLGGVEIIYI